jgi:hypothetical protein
MGSALQMHSGNAEGACSLRRHSTACAAVSDLPTDITVTCNAHLQAEHQSHQREKDASSRHLHTATAVNGAYTRWKRPQRVAQLKRAQIVCYHP